MPAKGWVDYKALKAAVSIPEVLDHYGLLEKLSERGDALVGSCPIHKGENKTSFRVSLAKNVFHCFSCDAGGNVLDLVAALEGVSLRDAALSLQAWHPGPPTTETSPPSTPPLPEEVEDGEANEPLNFALKSLDAQHPYLAERGLSEETIATFGLGFYSRRGLLHDRIAIPIHNAGGELVAYAGRFLGTPAADEPKYKLPVGFRKSLELFNLHRAAATDGEVLIVVEGFFDCMTLWQRGLRRTVALMGSTLSTAQARLIGEAVGRGGRVELLFDEDAAGRAGRDAAASRLAPLCYVRSLALPHEGAQPEDLDGEVLRQLLA